MHPDRPSPSGYSVPLRLLRAQLRAQLPDGTPITMLQWSRQESRASRDAEGWLCVGTLHALGRSWGAWWHPARRAWGDRELRECQGMRDGVCFRWFCWPATRAPGISRMGE